MTPKQVNDIFNELPSKRRKVLVGFLAGHSREKIMIDADVPSDAALTGHLKELYKNFRIDTGWNDADDRRTGARKLPLLISLFARCKPELISDRISEVLDNVEQEEAISNPHQESVESDAGSIEERIFKATNQLDPERPIYSRMSAIQALEKIANDDPKYHWNIIEILAAFVRNNARRKVEEEGEEERSLKLREDIQAALTVIGRRDPNKDLPNLRLDLSNTDLRGADLREAKLQGANFYQTNLQGTILIEAQLQGADLGKVNLQQANLIEANLQGSILTEAQLQGAFLNKTNLQQADLIGANLKGAHLSSAELQRTLLKLANLQSTRLFHAQLQGADIRRSDFSGASLLDANLKGAYIELADFRNAHQLTQEQIDSAKGLARLPDYLKNQRSESNANY